MAIRIESGLHSSEMTHAGYEIHHSRDNYDDYRPFPKDANVVHLHHHNFYEVFFFISGNVTYLVEVDEDETLEELDTRFTKIMNELATLGKEYTQKEIGLKIIRSLTSTFGMILSRPIPPLGSAPLTSTSLEPCIRRMQFCHT